MTKLQSRGVTIDYCQQRGGVYLDPGELEQLTRSQHDVRHSHGHGPHHDDHDEEWEEEF